MELQYETKIVSYMRRILHQTGCREVTQEFKLPDGLPDVGRILGAWGQVILRGKNWSSKEIELSGGTTMWVLYMPEDSDLPQCVETWIPFQMEFDIPNTDIDGIINAMCYLCSADARPVSARKMILRTNIGFTLEALASDKLQIQCYNDLPRDVQILKKTYPVCIPVEAGEKAFSIDEEIALPASCPEIEKIIRYDIRNEVIESKIMTDKIVFRGVTVVHITYISADNRIYGWDGEIPFSQYAQLNNDFETTAAPQMMVAVTGIELEPNEEGKIRIKAGVLCQYTVYDIQMLELCQDAYSTKNEIGVTTQNFEVPAMLDMKSENVTVMLQSDIKASSVADVCCFCNNPVMERQDNFVTIMPQCAYQVLYYDDDNVLQQFYGKGEGSWQLPVAGDADVWTTFSPSGNPQARLERSGVAMQSDVLMNAVVSAADGIETISNIDVLSEKENLADRPSLIIRRVGAESLWELSKKYGTTDSAILAANQPYDETDTDRVIIIPIS